MTTTTPATPPDYDAELRFGVVMYGGVSLAIYIYGVTNELYELACATPLDRDEVLPAAGNERGTRDFYRRLSLLAGNPSLRREYARRIHQRDAQGGAQDVWSAGWNAGPKTRFAIDVIAGTSAGGINGIFLAKALAKGQPVQALGQLWVDEGDIGKLINDRGAYDGLPPHVRPAPQPASLLSSDRMFVKLHQAFKAMQAAGPDDATSPLVEELDLYVTTTDIDGTPVPMRLADKVVYERRHRQRLHFSYPSAEAAAHGDAAEFGADRSALLAFAARCTSSFPFAFEPMTLERLRLLCPEIGDTQIAQWRAHFAEGPLPEEGRAFGDGGYLDNKPFSYVADALSQRFGNAPVQRKLLYVEPDPERLGPDDSAGPVPDALSNAMKALLVIPQYETIREDLRTILQRNRRIERIERIVQLAEEEAEPRADSFVRVECPGGKVRPWSSLTLDDMVRYYGDGFASYRRLRIYAVTDWLADQIAAAFGVDPQCDPAYALRAVVRAWREEHFHDNPPAGDKRDTTNAFLGRHDFDYRLRRTAFLMRRIDALTRLLDDLPPGSAKLEQVLKAKLAHRFKDIDPLVARRDLAPLLLAELRTLKRRLREGWRQLSATRRRWQRGDAVREAVKPDPLLQAELDAVLQMLLGMPSDGRLTRVRDVDGRLLDIPALGPWEHGSLAAQNLQDAVYERVVAWRDSFSGRPALRLWEELKSALHATRVDAKQGPTANVDEALNREWTLLGKPELGPQELVTVTPDGERLVHHYAELEIVPPTEWSDGRPFADDDERRACTLMRRMLGHYYLSFDWFDQTRFTLYYDTATGEPSTVDVLRVSPADADALRSASPGRQTLAGVAVAHFGAFLDAHWRRNDIMWGRLDGAERLVAAVLPGADADTVAVRNELCRLAHRRILKQTMHDQRGELARLLRDALRQTDGKDAADRLARLLASFQLPQGAPRDALAATLADLLGPDALIDLVKTQPTFDPEPPPEPTLKNMARAITVTGRILEAISDARAPQAKSLTRWAARIGLVLQGAMAVAVPGSFTGRWFRSLMPMLYTLEVLLLLAALLFGGAEMHSVVISILVATAAGHVGVLVLRDHLVGGYAGRTVLALVFALLLGLGILGLWRDGPVGAVCGPAPAGSAASQAQGAWSRICGWAR